MIFLELSLAFKLQNHQSAVTCCLKKTQRVEEIKIEIAPSTVNSMNKCYKAIKDMLNIYPGPTCPIGEQTFWSQALKCQNYQLCNFVIYKFQFQCGNLLTEHQPLYFYGVFFQPGRQGFVIYLLINFYKAASGAMNLFIPATEYTPKAVDFGCCCVCCWLLNLCAREFLLGNAGVERDVKQGNRNLLSPQKWAFFASL